MKLNIWIRTVIFLLGVSTICFLLILGNIQTEKLDISPDSLIEFETMGDQLYMLTPEWGFRTEGGQEVFSADFRISTSNTYSGIYVPRSENVELFINGSTDNIIRRNEYLFYLFPPMQYEEPISLELHLPKSPNKLSTTAHLYIGNYNSIMFVSYRESNLRLFIIGISFTIILFSISLYVQKTSEKYLLLLALLAYSTFGYVLLKAYPALQENFWTSLLLLGPVQLPFISAETSNLLYRLGFPLVVSYINFLLIKNFVSVKLFKVDYFYFVIPLFIITLMFIGNYQYSIAVVIFRISINIMESIMIIKGEYVNKTDTVILMSGAIGAVGMNLFIAGYGTNIIPHGNMDLLFRLGGVYASSFPIAFTIATNGIFARKYAESEVLSKELNDLNQNLQLIVNERTSELVIAYKQLENEQNQKDIFTTNMVHSLKTPLFSIAGFADMAQEALQSAPEKASHFINLINSNTDFVVKLVNNLFLALRLENNKVNYMIEKVNLSMIMEQIYNTTLPLSQMKDIHIQLNIPTNPVLIECDPYYLTLAIQNIVDNAVRHTPKERKIEFSLLDFGQKVQIIIKDNGEGIPDGIIDRIFERYYSHSNQGQESSGLGLSISKDVITALQGQISVSSKVNEGTEFEITFPKFSKIIRVS